MPTAPENFAICLIDFRREIRSAIRTEKTAISLPKVVGIAGRPCVRASITVEASCFAMADSFNARSEYLGIMTFSSAEPRSMAEAKLFVSSLVRPRWTKGPSSLAPAAPSESLM